MTQPSADTLEREKEKLYLTDIELIRRLGVPERDGRVALREWEARQPSFPRRDKLMGGRWYWPAVKAWLDRRNGLKMDVPEPERKRHVR